MFVRRAIFAFLALLPGAFSAQLHVDHATVAGRDLAQMRKEFAAAGIVTECGGRHTNGLTEMAIASFADGSYLELIAAQKPEAGAAAHYWGKFIDNNAGPCAWAIAVPDIDAEAQRLHAHVNASGRKRPDGVSLQWKTASIGTEPQGTFLPFLIQDLTDRKLRAFPGGKPTMPEMSGVAEVYIAVRNLDEAVRRYQQAFGLAPPELSLDKELGARVARFSGTPVVLAAPAGKWLAERLDQFGEAPCAIVIASKKPGPVRWLPIRGMRIGISGGHS